MLSHYRVRNSNCLFERFIFGVASSSSSSHESAQSSSFRQQLKIRAFNAMFNSTLSVVGLDPGRQWREGLRCHRVSRLHSVERLFITSLNKRCSWRLSTSLSVGIFTEQEKALSFSYPQSHFESLSLSCGPSVAFSLSFTHSYRLFLCLSATARRYLIDLYMAVVSFRQRILSITINKHSLYQASPLCPRMSFSKRAFVFVP